MKVTINSSITKSVSVEQMLRDSWAVLAGDNSSIYYKNREGHVFFLSKAGNASITTNQGISGCAIMVVPVTVVEASFKVEPKL